MSKTTEFFTSKTGINADFFLQTVMEYLEVVEPTEPTKKFTIFFYNHGFFKGKRPIAKAEITKDTFTIERIYKVEKK